MEYDSLSVLTGTSTKVRKLQLTDFSRQCLQLWIQRHGRRFRCYKKRADTGVTRGSSNLGTFEAVKKRQGQAIASLLQKEKPGNSVEFAGHKLQVYAQASSSSKDSLRKFGDLTQQKKRFKSSWDSSIPSPPLRRSTVFANKATWSPPAGCVILNMTGHSLLPYGVAGKIMNPKLGVEKVQSEEVEKSHLLVAADIGNLEKMTAGPLGRKLRCRLRMVPV